MYADVVVNRPTHRRPPTGAEPLRGDTSRSMTFTYRLPQRFRETAAVGHLVQVPLGGSMALGVIVDVKSAPRPELPADSIREVREILDPLPVVTPGQIALARWIAVEYLEPLSQSMRLMLPPGLEARTSVVVRQLADVEQGKLSVEERSVLRYLEGHGGRLRLSTLMNRLRGQDAEGVMSTLADRGLVDTRYALVPPKPAPPRVQYVRLLADDETIDLVLPRLGRASKQADLLLVLGDRFGAPLSKAQLCRMVDCSPGPVKALEQRKWVRVSEARTLVVAHPDAVSGQTTGLVRAPQQKKALSALVERGIPVELSELLKDTGVSRATVAALEEKGLVERVVQQPVVLLALSQNKVLDRIVELRGAEKQRAVLDSLRGSRGRVWVGGLYAETGADLTTLKRLAAQGLISLHAEEFERPRYDTPEEPHQLTGEQRTVWESVERDLRAPSRKDAPSVMLLHGVTGSGKTEIYLQALEQVLEAGERGIVLVPEISLTAQAVRRFEARFPGRVAVMHSQLSLGQRYAVWDRVRRGETDILIGPRSALFAPITRLGLIVLDEAHDESYKQDDPLPLPSYHARDAAIARGRLAGAPVILGSATPDLVSYNRARGGKYRLLELPHRVPAWLPVQSTPPTDDGEISYRQPPAVRVVDLRQELRAGNRGIFSRSLQELLQRTLRAGEQSILFLNRRGSATFVLCRECGYVVLCPNCDTPLTLHRHSTSGGETNLVCHRCNHRQAAPERCPSCGSRRVRYFGLGTERVEAELRQLLPTARLLRWDRDTAAGADHERFLQKFTDHRADVLIGTQMIAKGLDLPLVTLVGVISADTALYLPDYRASERTFQLLTQVAGRAGRSYRGGQVIVQTYNPEHYAIQFASRHDYSGFYRKEITYRRLLDYPPFKRLLALRFHDRDAQRCRAEAQRMGMWLAGEIRRLDPQADLIGPAPCYFQRTQGRYRWQIVIRANEPAAILGDVALPQGWSVDVDPVRLL